MVYACYSIFNEEQFLKISLQSIVDNVEKVIIVDGAWRSFPTTEFASTDKSKAIAKKMCGKKLIWIDAPEDGWKSEVLKRTHYVKLVPNGEWFFVIDGDEIITGDVAGEFSKVEANQDLHMCLVPISFHTPYASMQNLPSFNEIGSYKDLTNVNAQEYLDTINESNFSTIPWITTIGHRYALYKKEEGMEYNNHHSNIWINGESIFNIYGIESKNQKPNKRIYKLTDVIMDDLKYMRNFNRWKMNMVDKTRRIRRGQYEVHSAQWLIDIEKYKRHKMLDDKSINPIMIIRSPRDNPVIEQNFDTITSIDKLWIKHYPIFTANQKLLDWVMKNNKNYTHVIMTTDDVMFSQSDLNQLIDDLKEYDFPILTGVCNFCHIWMGPKQGTCCLCNENKPHEYLSATFNPLADIIIKGEFLHNTKTPAISRDTYDFIPDNFRVENPIIKQVYFHGIALTAIRMDIFLKLDGLHLYNKDKGISADDVNLAIECYNRNILQFADFKVFVQHLGGKDIYPKINISSGARMLFQEKNHGKVIETIEPTTKAEQIKVEPAKIIKSIKLATEEEFNKFVQSLVKYNITIPTRPSHPVGESVFDNISNQNLNQQEWDKRYGKWSKFIK
jgi:hypothetical protein